MVLCLRPAKADENPGVPGDGSLFSGAERSLTLAAPMRFRAVTVRERLSGGVFSTLLALGRRPAKANENPALPGAGHSPDLRLFAPTCFQRVRVYFRPCHRNWGVILGLPRMRKAIVFIAALAGAALFAQQTSLFPALKSVASLGKQPGGEYLAPINQLLRPWSEQTPIAGRPVDMTFDSQKRVLAVLNWKGVLLLDSSTGARPRSPIRAPHDQPLHPADRLGAVPAPEAEGAVGRDEPAAAGPPRSPSP